MTKRKLSSGVALVAGVMLIGHGAWIPAKALLAQVLLRDAWTHILQGSAPTKPWPWADTWPVARMTVPALDVDLIVLAGDSGAALAFGPGHMSASPLPGEPGNSVISAHRDTHFAFLADLRPGHEIVVQTSDAQVHRFSVTDSGVLDTRRQRLRLDGEQPALTLATCYPFNAPIPGGPLRYTVQARESTRGHLPGKRLLTAS